MKIAVLVSGSGSNLQAIIDAIQTKQLTGVAIEAVIADRNCYGIERALAADLNTWCVERNKHLSEEVNEICTTAEVDIIVLAGFLSILNEDFCAQWEKKIINLHPSLLPKFGGMGMYGANVHKAVLAANESQSGATVHYVSSGVDEGEIILQDTFEIPPEADLAWLQNQISEIEKPLLLKAIQRLADDHMA